MNELRIHEIAQALTSLLPTLDRKLIRPLEQQSRQLVSPLMIHTLEHLEQSGSIPMSELAKELLISKPQLTSVVEKLIDNGWVAREADAADRRIIRIKITGEGSAMLNRLHTNLIQTVVGKIERLEQEELESLQDALSELHRIIRKL